MANQNDRNRVLSITMKMIDKMSPAIKFATGVLNKFKAFATGVFRAITLPVKLLGSSIGALATPIGLVRAALAFLVARGIARVFTATAEMGDQLLMMSQRLGVTVEELSVLRHAGEQADVEMEGLSNSFKFLGINAQEASRGIGRAKSFFEGLGVAFEDVNGNVRPTMDIFEDIADQFQNMADGSGKGEAAVRLFGKAGLQIIPLLNEGSEGLRRYADDARRLGVVFTETEARQSDAFGDGLLRVKAALIGVRNAIALAAMPALTDLFNNMANWTASNRTTLRRWAAEGTATIVLFAKAAASLGQLIAKMATDPESSKALGETFKAMALGYVGVMRESVITGFRVIGNIVTIAARPILKGVSILAVEIGRKIRDGILDPFTETDEEMLQNLRATLDRVKSEVVRFRDEADREMNSPEGSPARGQVFSDKAFDLEQQADQLVQSIKEMEAKVEAPMAAVTEKIGQGFQDVVAGIRTDTSDIAAALDEGRDAISIELQAMINAIEQAGGEGNPHIDAFIARIETLKGEFIAAREAARSMADEVADVSATAAPVGTPFELAFDEETTRGMLQQQRKFHAMLATGRRRAILEEVADFRDATDELQADLDERKINYATYLLGIEALQAEHDRRMQELNGSFVDGAKRAFEDWRDEITNQFKNGADAVSDILQGMTSGFENVFESVITGTKSAKEAWKDFGREVLGIIAKIVARQVALSVVGALFPGFGAAKGMAFAGGNIQYMAKGGLLNRPTMFSSNDGPVVGGEAGTEAIMPLKRDRRTGELGIRAVGGGRGDVYNVNIAFSLPGVHDAKGLDRAMLEHADTIEQIVTRAIHTKHSMKQAIRAA
jgi:lambda family phage tail tape measure protein